MASLLLYSGRYSIHFYPNMLDMFVHLHFAIGLVPKLFVKGRGPALCMEVYA